MKVTVIGVAGGTGSGKSTLVKRLQEAFEGDDVVTLCHDYYYKAHPELTYEERTKLNYDHPQAFDTQMLVDHIKALKENVPIEHPVYSFVEHNRMTETVSVKPSKVIIVDGILIFENKELRDLDLKKNYEQKLALCEQAEALVLEPSIVEAFHKLQKLHDEWREIGPVANEYKEVLWNRFKEASSRINKQHQEFFENIKQEQLRNLELKSELCVKAEELAQQPLTSRKEWNKASEKLFEIQKVWKTIGFAPKKDNNAIYERFRNACDKFFEAKRAYYAGLKGEMEHNLQLKTELCEAAEALRDSEEWKKTTDELIALQAKWKQTGAVSRRYSDQIWKRFRAACDAFFERKSRHFAAVDDQYGENLRRKEALLEEMAAADILAGGFEMIRDFQRRWGEIGFVPIKQKEAIQKRYKEVVDKMFDTLRGSERDRSMDRFKEKVSSLKASGDRRLRTERDRLYNKVRQLEQDIALLENNIGFFSKSKNAEAMIAEVRAKIERAKQEMQAAIEKVKLIDQEENKE